MSDIMGEFFDFAEIQNQVNRREMNRVYQFNLMLVGPNAIGKSTLVTSLFRKMITPAQVPRGNPRLNEYTDLLVENGVQLRLKCVETSRFNRIDDELIKTLVDYIDEQFTEYFISQRRSSPWKAEDQKIHCCLYLVPSFGDGHLSQEDVDCMLALHERVNIVPIIAQADNRNQEEMREIKENIKNDLIENGIKYYNFSHDKREDEERAILVEGYAKKFPFAIIAANEPRIVDNKKVWIRRGIKEEFDIDDEKLCDFDALQKLLVRHCMLDLVYTTHNKHYIKFRNELLDKSLRDSGKPLLDIGLEQHEVDRIKHDLSAMPNDGDMLVM